MKKTLIIIPAFNEDECIVQVVNNIINNYPQYDYVVINDGSSDNTAQVCMNHNFNLLNLPINLGLAGAFQTGAKYAYEKGYEYAVQLDGDGQHDPKYIESMIEAMNENDAHIVIGSRFYLKSKRKFSLRVVGSLIISTCIYCTTKKKIYDPTSGMRLYSRRVLKEFAYTMNFAPEPDTMSFLIRCGIKIVEIQVDMNDRLTGTSYLNLRYAIKYMLHMCISILLIQDFRKRR